MSIRQPVIPPRSCRWQEGPAAGAQQEEEEADLTRVLAPECQHGQKKTK